MLRRIGARTVLVVLTLALSCGACGANDDGESSPSLPTTDAASSAPISEDPTIEQAQSVEPGESVQVGSDTAPQEADTLEPARPQQYVDTQMTVQQAVVADPQTGTVNFTPKWGCKIVYTEQGWQHAGSPADQTECYIPRQDGNQPAAVFDLYHLGELLTWEANGTQPPVYAQRIFSNTDGSMIPGNLIIFRPADFDQNAWYLMRTDIQNTLETVYVFLNGNWFGLQHLVNLATVEEQKRDAGQTYDQQLINISLQSLNASNLAMIRDQTKTIFTNAPPSCTYTCYGYGG